MLEEAGQVDTSYYYYTDVVGDKAIFDLIGIDALVNNGSLILDVYTNFPESGTTVGSAPVFAADLAIDVATGGNPLDSPFEFGVALSETEGLKSCINE